MATTENYGLWRYIDESGNVHILYPVTKPELVDGLDELLADKAPAGYGYGDPITITISNTQTGDELDFDTALEAVFGQMQNYSCRQVQFTDFSSGVGDVFTGTLYKNWADYGWLKGTSYSGYTMQKVKKNGAWHNREWLNPPMVPGVEYRTTERWNGNPIYTMLISCGKGPASGAANLYTQFPGNAVFTELHCKGVQDDGWGNMHDECLSFGENGAAGIYSVVSITGAGDLSAQNLYLTAKYYKA